MCCCRFLSPIGAAIVCLLLFLIIRTLVLRRKDSTKWSFYVLPILLLVTVFINLFFIITKVHLGGGVWEGGPGRQLVQHECKNRLCVARCCACLKCVCRKQPEWALSTAASAGSHQGHERNFVRLLPPLRPSFGGLGRCVGPHPYHLCLCGLAFMVANA